MLERVDDAIDRLLAEHPPATTGKHEFWGAQFDAGLAWVHFPEGLGGLGVDPKLAEHVDERLEQAGAPSNVNENFMLVGMAGPTIVALGSDEHKQRFLRPGFSCEEIWCQLFSEPGAGSDLAALSTRAELDGDEWVFNGQKVWTTLAHVADWAMILARTDPSAAPKHGGLTYFLIDMRQPGIEVRPLRQINGEAEFNEVYLTDARTPDALRIGEVGDGWRVAITTLMNERTAFGHLAKAPRGAGAAGPLVELFRLRGDGDEGLRDDVTRKWIEGELVRLTTLRAQELRDRGTPGPEGSVIKLAYTWASHTTYALCVDLLGADGLLIDNYEMVRPSIMGGTSLGDGGKGSSNVQKAWLTSLGGTIGGGTSAIGKNVLAERVLGLPGDVRVDKDLPWSEVPKKLSWVADLDEQGYAVLEDAAPLELFDRLRDAIVRVTDEHHARGVTPFDFGPNTSMIYRLLARDEVFLEAVLAPRLIEVMEHLLDPGYVANAMTGSQLHEGAQPGPLHADNQFFPEPFPPQVQVATAIWCLDDFSGELGSTHLVPGSHLHGRQPRAGEGIDQTVPVEAPRGSIVVWTGHTWHRSGGRSAPGTRVALHTAFSRPHIRRFEAYTPEEIDRIVAYDARLTRIVGADLPYDCTGDGPDLDKLLALAATAMSALSGR